MRIVEQYLRQLNTKKLRFRHSIVVLSVLSLLVMGAVCWNLRQTGIAIANDACCGFEEHFHTEDCPKGDVLICGYDDEAPEAPSEEAPEPSEEEIEVISEDETTEESTEAPTEESTEAPTEESTEAPTEESTEAPTEESTEAPTEESTEAVAAASLDAPEETVAETQADSALDAILDIASDVISEIIPVAQAAEIPEETQAEETQVEETTGHVHTAECYEYGWLCGYEEHIHTIECYSDTTADLEDWSIWQASVPELTGRIAEDIVLVAQSQLGVKESEVNFELAEDGVTENGITRYGQWYGNPYGSWSNMFTSFCIRFAGGSNLPVNSGAERMMMDWEALNLYRHAGGYEPLAGDIIFFDKNQNGTPESTGVVARYFDFILTVIEGDVDNTVVQREYRIDDPVVFGYGMTNTANRVIMLTNGNPISIGQTYNNNNLGSVTAGSFILYTNYNGAPYAIDGNGNAVPITIENNVIKVNVDNPMMLYWTFTVNNGNYTIINEVTRKYLYPNNEGLLHDTSGTTNINNNRFRTGTNYNYRYVQLNGTQFTVGGNNGATFSLGRATGNAYYVWLDGTNGNIMSYSGSDNSKYVAFEGIELQLPSEWKSPTAYQYKLAGWVDIYTGTYYTPGQKITVTKNMVLYADWVAASYNIGQLNNQVVDTVSTNDFITTYLFDYSSLINLNSTMLNTANSSMSATSHTEYWTHVAGNGTAASGKQTIDFSFVDDDWGDGNYNNGLDDPSGRNDNSTWTGENGIIRTGILGNRGTNVQNHRLITTLFGLGNSYNPQTGEGVLGKHYLGKGDHLFQLNEDPTDTKYYGYYYYDSDLNAASYNQSAERFYVYDYLERSSDSPGNGSYSDFLPLNSPYVNTGNGVTLDGNDYEYEARSDAGETIDGTKHSNTRVDWWFGMRTDIHFGLPDDPSEDGKGNIDLHGKQMHFHFTGDDDVWILIDGKLVLDLGGIHLAVDGDINFSTGVITAKNKDGTVAYTANLSDYGIGAGEHTLSILYLERGASMGNCAIYFNLAPRFSLTMEKEDVLTQERLEGATFAIFTDEACKNPCDLWLSQADYSQDLENKDTPGYKPKATNEFTIVNGQAYIWGLSPSKTYYIKEIGPPTLDGYGEENSSGEREPMKGIIKLTFDMTGLNSDGAVMLPENGEITNGFTVHGYQIDQENQAAYISITNAQNWVTHTTSIYVDKRWINDNKDHTYDSVTVYLQVTDPDGTVRRIRQIELCEENDWHYTWSNLPLYIQNPETGEEMVPEEGMDPKEYLVQYSVVEAYKPGYQQSIQPLTSGEIQIESWTQSGSISNGGDYILWTEFGYLAVDPDNGRFRFVEDRVTAMGSDYALWRVTGSQGKLALTNVGTGRSINYYNGAGNNNKYFTAVKTTAISRNMSQAQQGNGTIVLYNGNNNYIGKTLNSNGYLMRVDRKGNALVITPIQKTVTTENIQFEGSGFRVNNEPLTSETAVKVIKEWDLPPGTDESIYRDLKVTFKLLSNDVDTGRTVTVEYKYGWTATFEGLPKNDNQGNPITYTVLESWNNKDWIAIYDYDRDSSETANIQEVYVTNKYRWTNAVVLPETGGIGYPIFILIGLSLMGAPFVYGFRMRRRYRKGESR